jgi:pimeloyl-ACP methyl ester carboxylesterase
MPRFDDATGRYVYVEIEGVEYRVYFEETGSGIPMLLQHTAGADGRQWRHLLEDRELQQHFRMVAYDLPYHGKSVPPVGVQWWAQEYRLTKRFLMASVLAIGGALGMQRPVYMGSSIGGHLALDLALHHPEAFRAVVGVEAGLSTPGGFDDMWYHPRVSNDFKASVMYGLMSPTSPEAFRRETAWVYSQGAPPTFKGDLYYYSVDHDLTQTAGKVDASKVAVYILNGEYDWSGTPEGGKAAAAAIPGSHWAMMPGLGHFPMSEDPAAFKACIAPVLEAVRKLV